MSNYHFFHSGPFSQWYRSPFTATVPIPETGESKVFEFNCAEQYMMACKAILFNDSIAFDDIMSTNDPRRQKVIGRTVKNFDVEIWNAMAKTIVFHGNCYKFGWNEGLLDQLLSTGDDIIVEASPTDCIWGIGLSMVDTKRFNPENWRGTNWLGETLMKVRKSFQILRALKPQEP